MPNKPHQILQILSKQNNKNDPSAEFYYL